jgi:hypothetical protein
MPMSGGSLAELLAGLRPALADLELMRRRKKLQLSLLGFMVACGWAWVAGGLLDMEEPSLLVLSLAVAIGAFAVQAQFVYQPYHLAFKEGVIRQLVRLVYPDACFLPMSGLPEQDFEAAQIFQTSVAAYKHEDLIEASIGETRFRMSDVHAQYRGHKNRLHTLFRGVVIVADFPKRFKGRTVLLPEGCFGDRPKGLQAVILEPSPFERDFVVYASDQIEARYILSPALMERLVRVNRRFSGDVRISFANSQILVAIADCGERLEAPPLFTALTSFNEASVCAYLEDIRLAATLIEELNLNLRIWSTAEAR